MRSLRRSKSIVPYTFVLASASFLAFTMLAPAAGAQEEPLAADVAAARALGQEGVKLADAGNCSEALNKLERAEKMFHAPTTLGRLGECQVMMGKLVEGTENLHRVVRETLSPTAPLVFSQAQERARKVLATAKPRIAKLKIAVAAPSDAQIVVKVDGENVPIANLNTNRPIDPGEHVVEVSAPGFKHALAKISLGEGAVDSVALTLEVDPNAPKRLPASIPALHADAGPNSGPPTGASRSRAPAYLVLGLGAAGVGVGAVFGALALGKKQDLSSACKDNVCSSEQQNTIDSGKTLATVSTVGFGVGVVGLGIGTFLLLTGGPSASSSTRAQERSRVVPVIGSDRVGLSGTF